MSGTADRRAALRIDTTEEVLLAGNDAALVDGGAGYRVAYAIAADNLRLAATVVADAVNPIGITPEAWRRVARSAGVPIIDVMLICSDSTQLKGRIEAWPVGTRGSDWAEVQSRLIKAADGETVVIDTSHQTVDQCVDALERILRARSHRFA